MIYFLLHSRRMSTLCRVNRKYASRSTWREEASIHFPRVVPVVAVVGRPGDGRAGHDHDTCASSLKKAEGLDERKEGLDALGLAGELDDDAMLADVDNAAAELGREPGHSAEVVAAQLERLRGRERQRRVRLAAALEALGERHLALELRLCFGGAVGGAVWEAPSRVVRGPALQLLLDVLWAEDGDFGEEELALDAVRVGVVEHGPYGYLGRVRSGDQQE